MTSAEVIEKTTVEIMKFRNDWIPVSDAISITIVIKVPKYREPPPLMRSSNNFWDTDIDFEVTREGMEGMIRDGVDENICENEWNLWFIFVLLMFSE